MRRVALLLLLTALSITGCSQQGTSSGGAAAQSTSTEAHGILASLRPKADPNMVERMHAEEAAALAKQQELAAAQQQAMGATGAPQFDANGLGRVLPKVSMDPIAPPAEEVASQGPVITPEGNNPFNPVTFASSPAANNPMFAPPAPAATAAAPPPPPSVATYAPSGGGMAVPPPPPAGASLGGGLVPPPPAVTLSTQAQTVAGMPPGDPNNPYANPYMNPYAIPYPQQAYPPQYQQQYQQPAPPAQQQRPSGSPFAAGGGTVRTTSDAPEEDPKATERARKAAAFVPITPTGMESRSAYKQRDDVKVLWKGALTSGPLAGLAKDEKFAEQLNHIDVSLPGESTKGSFSPAPRQIDAFFKTPQMDKRLYPSVRKVETELVQTYMRYLYAYNRFSLASQTVAARKQESEMASSASEQQRAAADMAQSQSEADSARDDMKSAQTELAMIAGPQAARTIIGRVSGVTPSLESLNVAEAPAPQAQKGGGLFGFGGFGGFGKGGGKKDDQPQQPAQEAAAAPPAKVAKAEEPKEKKSKAKDKKGKEKSGDLQPAPQVAEKSADEPAAQAAAPQGGDISFELKGVNVTPRKSVLTVAIRNAGANNFSISPEVISISEGNRKLSEASVRADFDTTLVQPNQEVKGTITIFGRPWSDKLAVVLSDGGKSIQLHR